MGSRGRMHGSLSSARCLLAGPAAYNVEITSGNDLLQPVSSGDTQLYFGSLACSHTNQGLRAVAGGAKCPVREFASEDGAWCLQLLAAAGKEFGSEFETAVRQGLKWKVIRHPVLAERPAVLRLLSEARNQHQTAAKCVSEAEVALQLWLRAKPAQREGKAPNWADICAVVFGDNPALNEIKEDLLLFVCKRAGGMSGDSLKEWVSFYNASAGSRRIPARMYRAIADFRYDRLGLAILKTLATCEPKGMQGGLCTWFPSSLVDQIGNADGAEAALAATAERILKEARGLLATLTPPPKSDETTAVLCLSWLDIRVGRIIVRKDKTTDRRALPVKLWDRASGGRAG